MIRSVPDFPKPGINFYDITTLLKEPVGLKATIEALSGPYTDARIDAVVGIESRGFILGSAVAQQLGAGFIPVRKPGKLPAKAIKEVYELEYGKDAIEIHAHELAPRIDDGAPGIAAHRIEVVEERDGYGPEPRVSIRSVLCAADVVQKGVRRVEGDDPRGLLRKLGRPHEFGVDRRSAARSGGVQQERGAARAAADRQQPLASRPKDLRQRRRSEQLFFCLRHSFEVGAFAGVESS